MSSVKLTGMDEFFDKLKDMEISNNLEMRALSAGGNIIKENIIKNTPKGTIGKLERGTTGKVVKLPNGEMAYKIVVKAYYAGFVDWGTSKSKKNVGYFGRAIEDVHKKSIEAVKKVILKEVTM